MPLTTLDAKAALIVIDLQKGTLAIPTAHLITEIVTRAAQLAQAFRHRELTVVLVNVTGAPPGRTDTGRRKFPTTPDWTELIAELDEQPSDLLISKQCVSAFTGTALDGELRGRSVTQVFLVGIATSGGVESSARSARDLGYNVVCVTDAMTDTDASVHRNSVQMIFPRIAETATTGEVLLAIKSGA